VSGNFPTSKENRRRRKIGLKAIRLCAEDANERAPDGEYTAASDVVADVLHALFGVYADSKDAAKAEEFLNHALRAWVGDAEDEA
jgi:hypothetical protein